MVAVAVAVGAEAGAVAMVNNTKIFVTSSGKLEPKDLVVL